MQPAARTPAPYPGSPHPHLGLLLETTSLRESCSNLTASQVKELQPGESGGKCSHSICCPTLTPGQDGPAAAGARAAAGDGDGDGGAPGARQSPAPCAGAGPMGCLCPNLINKHSQLCSAISPIYRAATISKGKSPFSVSPAANYSVPVRQSVLNLAVRGLLKEIMQQCPLSGGLKNNILRDRRKLMRKCGVYKPLSLPMLEGLTINTWSIIRSFSKIFFKGIEDDTEEHENNLINMMSL